MVGGDQAAFERANHISRPWASVFYYCGAAGQGLQAKLTQNLVLANIMQAFAEGIVLAAKGGITPALMLEILDNSAAKSGLIERQSPFHPASATSAPTSPPNGCTRTSVWP